MLPPGLPRAHTELVRSSGPVQLAEAALAAGVRDASVLQALREVPRAGFVSAEFSAQAYIDKPLPIPHAQVTTQPSLVAKMLEALDLKGIERVLEIGTGHGFQSALLARLAGFVWSVERWDDLAATARQHLAVNGVENVRVIVGDGSRGLPEHAPYDSILVSAAFPSVPPPLVEQLVDGGRLVQPIGPGGSEQVLLFEKRLGRLGQRGFVTGAHFVPLYGEHGFTP
jgi:protein-L-isoaspartate(D-aspartate) O-methyltransferase